MEIQSIAIVKTWSEPLVQSLSDIANYIRLPEHLNTWDDVSVDIDLNIDNAGFLNRISSQYLKSEVENLMAEAKANKANYLRIFMAEFGQDFTIGDKVVNLKDVVTDDGSLIPAFTLGEVVYPEVSSSDPDVDILDDDDDDDVDENTILMESVRFNGTYIRVDEELLTFPLTWIPIYKKQDR